MLSLLLNIGLLLHLIVLTVASPPTRHTLHSRSLSKGLAKVITSCNGQKTAALTFDDGPYIYLYNISNLLVSHNAKGTFFFNGNNYDCIYSEKSVKAVKYAYAHGHQIASHTWAHKDLVTLSYNEIYNEMLKVNEAIQKIIGVVPSFVRPPYGKYNDDVRRAAYALNQQVAIWDFDSLDSDGASWEKSQQLYKDAIAKHPSSVIALNHETYEDTANHIVGFAIEALQNAGYKLVTLAECLGVDSYQSVGEPGTRDDSWTC